MQILKKYAALIFFILAFPILGYFAKNFMLEPDTDIYSHIPQESDLVIEINTQNFIKEIGYQRIYEEAYYLQKMYPSEEEKQDHEDTEEEQAEKFGFDQFAKIVLFREQWATENVWIAVMKYVDEADFKSFVLNRIPEAQFAFGEKYAIVQLNASENQERLDEHLSKISNKEIKPFTERVDLASIFSSKKEVNCYVIPKVTHDNQLIEGSFSFDFLADHIALTGEFTPIPDFNTTQSIAYTLNEDAAMSMRSCLNIFNSIYWFNKERIENVPDYKQMAFDYDGVDCYLTKRDNASASAPPFNSYPKMKLQFDISESGVWYDFFDSLRLNKQIIIDTINKELHTADRAFFNYDLTANHFKLMDEPFALIKNEKEGLYFDFVLNFEPLIGKTQILIDEKNPPSTLEQSIFTSVASSVLEDVKTLASISYIRFQLKEGEENMIDATGRIEMKDKSGQSMIESLSFGTAVLLYLKNF